MGCFVRGGKNGMGCYVRGDKTTWDVMSGVTKTAWDVLSVVANLCGMFCPGCQKMAWDVLSRDVLSGSPRYLLGFFMYHWLTVAQAFNILQML